LGVSGVLIRVVQYDLVQRKKGKEEWSLNISDCVQLYFQATQVG